MKEMYTDFHYLMSPALYSFSASLCLLFPLSSTSLSFWSLFFLSVHTLASQIAVPSDRLGCQLILALSPRTEAKGHSGSFPFHCHWKCNRKRIPTMSETHVYIPLKIYIYAENLHLKIQVVPTILFAVLTPNETYFLNPL